MNVDETSLLETGFKAAVSVAFAIGAWMGKMLVSRIMNMDKEIQKHADDLNAHKLTVSENYAKKVELTPVYAKLDDIQNDIKQLLGRKQERDS